MALSIKNPETERLARELARVTGESITETVTRALRERMVREAGRDPDMERWLEGIREIQRRVAQLPVLESGTDEELIGYDEDGLPS
jgi:antitoxin VapB